MSIYNGVPPYNGDNLDDWCLHATLVSNGNLNGKTNNTGSFSLGPFDEIKVITVAQGRLGPDTKIPLIPTNLAASTLYKLEDIPFIPYEEKSLRSVSAGTFTVITPPNPDPLAGDANFDYILVG